MLDVNIVAYGTACLHVYQLLIPIKTHHLGHFHSITIWNVNIWTLQVVKLILQQVFSNVVGPFHR